MMKMIYLSSFCRMGNIRIPEVLVWQVCLSVKEKKIFMNIFKGSNCYIFISDSLLNGDPLLEEIICSYRSKLFPLRVDPL